MLSEDEILKVAKLAFLNLSKDEVAILAPQLNSIVEYIKQLDKYDVSETTPMSHTHGATNVFREDVASEPINTESYIELAPDRSGKFIKTPLVVDQG